MIGLLASIRPDSWNFPLFLHVLGAMVLVGAVTAAVAAQLWTVTPTDGDRLRRFSFRTLLFVAIPSWFVMAAGAEWIYSKEFGDASDDPTWIGIGFATREGGGLLLLIAHDLRGDRVAQVEERACQGLGDHRRDRPCRLDRRDLGDVREAVLAGEHALGDCIRRRPEEDEPRFVAPQSRRLEGRPAPGGRRRRAASRRLPMR